MLYLLGVNSKRAPKDYHEVINQYAAEGWRLVQIFAPAIDCSPTSTYFELIFEMEIEQKQ